MASDAVVLYGLIGVLNSHEFMFGRLVGMADALGECTRNSVNPNPPAEVVPENQSLAGTKTGTFGGPVTTRCPICSREKLGRPPEIALRTALGAPLLRPQRSVLDVLTGYRAEYQASQN